MAQPTQPGPRSPAGEPPRAAHGAAPPARTRASQPAEADKLRELLRGPGYLKRLVFCGLVGIPVSLAAFWFLSGMNYLQRLVWEDLPQALGHDTAPWWWPLPLLLVAGVCVGLVVAHFPGAGGHVPATGMHAGGLGPAALPGVVLAAVFSLPLGAVLGPEAPLIALGGGLALALWHLTSATQTPQTAALLGTAGAASAMSAIFGNPLIAAVLLMEIAGVGGPQLFAVMLPALLASGIGSLVFSGFGRWTGLEIGGLRLKPGVDFPRVDAGDVLWTVVIALVLAVGLYAVQYAGRLTALRVVRRPVPATALCALLAGVCACVYALWTGRGPAEVASSGQAALADLAGDPHAWSVGALVAVLLCKGLGYALCLGSLRGGPIFPALFLGAAAGVLLAPLPGLGVGAGLAAGMAASLAAVVRLPVSSVLLVVLVLGSTTMIPVAILASVVAFVTVELLPAGPEVPLQAVPR
ncbi:chloride channel protein [Streptomyces antimicrobicus]|uniref:Chloride channel protein n=1 Tax=Streptomyces antimicrobicus TaxID=2883108 RepID=A0ABS8B362_9ACTN|nr:chloride channel protein [Streptomyces antimicrobicus]MCB5179045.1 chloride channel protein [Streptomyces antimicrobicus]